MECVTFLWVVIIPLQRQDLFPDSHLLRYAHMAQHQKYLPLAAADDVKKFILTIVSLDKGIVSPKL